MIFSYVLSISNVTKQLQNTKASIISITAGQGFYGRKKCSDARMYLVFNCADQDSSHEMVSTNDDDGDMMCKSVNNHIY